MPVASEMRRGLHTRPLCPRAPTSWHAPLRSLPVCHLFRAAFPDLHSSFPIPLKLMLLPSEGHGHIMGAQNPLRVWGSPRAVSPELLL